MRAKTRAIFCNRWVSAGQEERSCKQQDIVCVCVPREIVFTGWSDSAAAALHGVGVPKVGSITTTKPLLFSRFVCWAQSNLRSGSDRVGEKSLDISHVALTPPSRAKCYFWLSLVLI